MASDALKPSQERRFLSREDFARFNGSSAVYGLSIPYSVYDPIGALAKLFRGTVLGLVTCLRSVLWESGTVSRVRSVDAVHGRDRRFANWRGAVEEFGGA